MRDAGRPRAARRAHHPGRRVDDHRQAARLVRACARRSWRGCDAGMPAFGTCAGLIVLAREAEDAAPGPAAARADRPVGAAQRLRPPGALVRGARAARRRARADARRLHPRAAHRRASATGVEVVATLDGGAGRGGVRGYHGGRVPSRADRRRPPAPALPAQRGRGASPRSAGIAERRVPCPAIPSGRRSSTRRPRPTRSAASCSRSSRARSSSRRRRAAPTRRQQRARERDREGARLLDAEGQHRARDPARRRRRRRGAYETVVYEGYGPGGAAFVVEALTDNRNRTAANVRVGVQQGRRLARADRLGRVHVRPQGRDRRRGRRRRGRADARGGRRRRRGRRGRRRRLAGHLRPGRRSRRCATRSRAPGFAIASAEIQMVPKTLTAVDDETAPQAPAAGRRASRTTTTSRRSSSTSRSPRRCSTRSDRGRLSSRRRSGAPGRRPASARR